MSKVRNSCANATPFRKNVKRGRRTRRTQLVERLETRETLDPWNSVPARRIFRFIGFTRAFFHLSDKGVTVLRCVEWSPKLSGEISFDDRGGGAAPPRYKGPVVQRRWDYRRVALAMSVSPFDTQVTITRQGWTGVSINIRASAGNAPF